jgi:hypothetical protein
MAKNECCIPLEVNAKFVGKIEDVLDVYTRLYNPKFPVVCMTRLWHSWLRQAANK